MPINVVIKESNKNKRFMAIFRDHKGGKVIKITHFGQKNPKIDKYMTAGSLSRYILWNKKTFNNSLKDYKKMFKLS